MKTEEMSHKKVARTLSDSVLKIPTAANGQNTKHLQNMRGGGGRRGIRFGGNLASGGCLTPQCGELDTYVA